MCLLHLPRQHSQFLWFLRRRFSWLFLITIIIRERTRKYLFHSVCFNNLIGANLIKFLYYFYCLGNHFFMSQAAYLVLNHGGIWFHRNLRQISYLYFVYKRYNICRFVLQASHCLNLHVIRFLNKLPGE